MLSRGLSVVLEQVERSAATALQTTLTEIDTCLPPLGSECGIWERPDTAPNGRREIRVAATTGEAAKPLSQLPEEEAAAWEHTMLAAAMTASEKSSSVEPALLGACLIANAGYLRNHRQRGAKSEGEPWPMDATGEPVELGHAATIGHALTHRLTARSAVVIAASARRGGATTDHVGLARPQIAPTMVRSAMTKS